jgi:hypothetical protein
MNPWPLVVSNTRWPPPKIGDEYRDGANHHHSTGSSTVPPNNHPRVGKHLAASGRGAAPNKTPRTPRFAQRGEIRAGGPLGQWDRMGQPDVSQIKPQQTEGFNFNRGTVGTGTTAIMQPTMATVTASHLTTV